MALLKTKSSNSFIANTLVVLLLLLSTYSFGQKAKKTNETLITLNNEKAKVVISTKGAQLQSFFNKEDNIEHLWQGDKKYWRFRAPILFPFIGKPKNGKYNYEGKEYKMKNHGFARDMVFTVIEKNDSSATLEITENSKTLKNYPFKFKLIVNYTLADTKLTVNYTVVNTDNKSIYFSLGSHPGFNVPFYKDQKFEDYSIVFEKNENCNKLLQNKKTHLLSGKKIHNYLNGGNILNLDYDIFESSVIALENLKSDYVTIENKNTKTKLEIGIKNFPYLGIWTSRDNHAPLLCIEPWNGISDFDQSNGNIKNKIGINKLEVGKEFNSTFYIKFKK